MWGRSGYQELYVEMLKVVSGVHVVTEDSAVRLPDGTVERRYARASAS